MKYSNVSIPLGDLPPDAKETILTANITEGIGALKSMLEGLKQDNSRKFRKIIPADYFGLIAHANHNMGMCFSSLYVDLSTAQFSNIFAKVENRLLDALLLMEESLGSLDELDIDTSKKTPREIENLNSQLHVVIFNDHSVTIGDNNTVKSSQIASSIDAQD